MVSERGIVTLSCMGSPLRYRCAINATVILTFGENWRPKMARIGFPAFRKMP
jgi:hypothetical protein